MAQEIFFKSLRNLETYTRNLKIFAFTGVGFMALVALAALWFAYQTKVDAESRIYVVEQGKSLIAALRNDVRENRPVEGKDHIRRFHELFFTLDPDSKAIQEHIDEALPYADESVARLYMDTKEKGYYNQLVQAAASQEIQVDSIQLDMTQYPYAFRAYSRQQIIRLTNITVRRLVTGGYLRNVSRSEVNPHGFLIERFNVLDNQDIEERVRQ
ncbi:conjugative transposon TraK protein [Spirosoma oryzae]|uniref:Conjugative transposon TraK protein n=1 Tax=Spirosoma oryzae TaxID=1469603 RepID=A0A2T0SNU2_9BACT|nr:conjugative transposon protein TraK [Spirosoma oryzae]PRY35046.1 conjugative transposon TraK protein [Spirosoma oryzae]